jgi:hypothetical protein
MIKSYVRPKEPDPIIWKDDASKLAAMSVASTTITVSSPFKASFADLTALLDPEPLSLPIGAFENSEALGFDEGESECGSRHGKFVSRGLSRECSLDADATEVDSDRFDLFTRLLKEADRISTLSGCHVKVKKLTMSKTCPYKTLLRHAYD